MPNIKLDKTDFKILNLLQLDGRITNAELADKVGLSPSPCLRRVKALEEARVIKRYVGIIDAGQVGLPISIFVSVSLKSQERSALEEFESHIKNNKDVMECYLMTGSYDYFLRVVMPDLESYEQFLLDKLTRIPCVSNIESSFSLKQIVYRTELPVGDQY